MGRRAEPPSFRIFINGEERSEFTPEEKERMSKRLSKVMSEYFSNHLDEYEDYCRRMDERAAAAALARE